MQIEQFNRESKGFFKATDDGKEAGVMTYSWAGPDKLIIDHTEVNPEFSGKGVGKQLLMSLVEFVRKEHIKVVPLCPFARAMFDKTQEIRDVLL